MKADARRRFRQHEQYLIEQEPGLKLVLDEDADTAKITGNIVVPLGAGRRDHFYIEIRYSVTDKGLNPFQTPETYDPGARFARDPDRHIETDGRFCMWLPHTDYDDFAKPDGLARHLNRIREFITLQIICEGRIARQIAPCWPGEQWGHGNDGYREWLREHVEGLTPLQVGRFSAALSKPPLARAACPCGGGRNFGRCHATWFRALQEAARHAGVTIWLELYEIAEGRDALESLLEEARQHTPDG
ncbi:SEC-C metal-binding domain-containing protein [Cellulomonas sp. ATA003]|uniref:SEC-C metal-binding domain-containing protein n=1 Tax=Cellulomonas sp. ATA003 TaxID=3073064 RepID=UPI0028731992|nr:SEC-C metal-binding domain-containing protein [Cellulomonas sp. ATA003]WNB85771.1 SEC-C metal-binding domain-containing protein [Cellulomonas sp. ATA003]